MDKENPDQQLRHDIATTHVNVPEEQNTEDNVKTVTIELKLREDK